MATVAAISGHVMQIQRVLARDLIHLAMTLWTDDFNCNSVPVKILLVVPPATVTQVQHISLGVVAYRARVFCGAIRKAVAQ